MMDKIRDRGNKKWAMSIMLPEHIDELNKWMDKENYEERPELSEWDLQSIQEEVVVSYKRKCETLIKTWKDGKVITRGGIIKDIDLRTMTVMLDTPLGIETILEFDIISVQCID